MASAVIATSELMIWGFDKKEEDKRTLIVEWDKHEGLSVQIIMGDPCHKGYSLTEKKWFCKDKKTALRKFCKVIMQYDEEYEVKMREWQKTSILLPTGLTECK